MAKAEMGITIHTCSECEKLNKGVNLYEMFLQGPYYSPLLRYEKESETFLINENALMGAIQMVSPAQQLRRLKLVSQEEFFNRK